MTYLLDTPLLIWALVERSKIPKGAYGLIADQENELLFSAVSVLEIGIKFSYGRPDFPLDPSMFRRELLRNGYSELPVTGLHAVEISRLPPIHKNPFDRLLIAQARAEGITLLTADAVVARYPGPIRKV